MSDCASELRADRRTIPRAAARPISSSGMWAARSPPSVHPEISHRANPGVNTPLGEAPGQAPENRTHRRSPLDPRCAASGPLNPPSRR